jgi:hypothetical protein
MRPIIVAALFALAACASEEADAPQAPPPSIAEKDISKADANALRTQIYPNWNIPIGTSCHQPVKVRVQLAENGAVQSVSAVKPELTDDDPCRPIQDSAIRAIWASTPLKVPHTRSWTYLTLVFDLDQML